MSEVNLAQNLNQAIDAILKGAEPESLDSSVVESAAVAKDLCDLPTREFKARLRHQLEQEVSMPAASKAKQSGKPKSESTTANVRKGFRTVTPYLVVADVRREAEFLKDVFAAKGKIFGGLGSKGGFHSEYRVGDSMLMIGGGGKGSEWQGTTMPASSSNFA